jgi:hypothetical protein
MARLDAHQSDDLVTVEQIGEALGLSESGVWKFAKRHELKRFRVPARGRWTLYRWGDVVTAYTQPVSVDETGKAAA